MEQKNTRIEIWRFLFMFAIVVFHYYGNCIGAKESNESIFLFRTGFIYVEWFFILTGFFTTKHFEENNIDIDDGLNYFYNRIKKIFPSYAITIVIAFLIKLNFFQNGIKEINCKGELINFLDNIFMITAAKISNDGMTVSACPAQLWYLSSMFIGLAFMCILLASKYKTIYMKILSVIVFVLYYGKEGFVERGVWPSDIMRGFASMSLGVFAYFIVKKLENKKITPNLVKCFTIIGHGVMGGTLFLTFKGHWEDIPLIVYMLFMGTVILNVGKCVVTIRIVNYLGKLSYYMFLVHFLVIMFINQTYFLLNYDKTYCFIIYIFVTMIGAALFEKMDCAIKHLKRYVKRCINYLPNS